MGNRDQIQVSNLRQLLKDDWPHPPVLDAWAFLVTETAELGDALLRLGYGQLEYVRHHDKEPSVANELADVYMMLCTVANHLNVDLSLALQARTKQIIRRVEDAE